MRKIQVTAQQVAEHAGVSPTTVSFVLSNKQGTNISENTRQRVLKVAEELGYYPHVAAQALAQGYSPNLGLILIRPHHQVFADPFVPNLMAGFSQVIKEEGFRVLVELIDDLNNLGTIEKMLRGREVAGIVVAGSVSGSETFLAGAVLDGYPIVILDPMENPDLPHVYIDHLGGVKTAVAHLIGLGHTRIACISYGPIDNPHVVLRLQAYRETLEDAGIIFDARLVREGLFEPETGYQATFSLMEQAVKPTAIFGMNDMMALGALSALQEMGLRVPEDVAVIGYDDMRFTGYLYPRLSTVRAPEVELGRLAGQKLIRLIHNDPEELTPIALGTELIVRDTCGARLRNQ